MQVVKNSKVPLNKTLPFFAESQNTEMANTLNIFGKAEVYKLGYKIIPAY